MGTFQNGKIFLKHFFYQTRKLCVFCRVIVPPFFSPPRVALHDGPLISRPPYDYGPLMFSSPLYFSDLRIQKKVKKERKLEDARERKKNFLTERNISRAKLGKCSGTTFRRCRWRPWRLSKQRFPRVANASFKLQQQFCK